MIQSKVTLAGKKTTEAKSDLPAPPHTSRTTLVWRYGVTFTEFEEGVKDHLEALEENCATSGRLFFCPSACGR